MRIECGIKPLLRGRRGIWGTKSSGDLGKGLVVVDEGAATAEIGSDHMAKQLHQRLPVPQNA